MFWFSVWAKCASGMIFLSSFCLRDMLCLTGAMPPVPTYYKPINVVEVKDVPFGGFINTLSIMGNNPQDMQLAGLG
jgi:hypothetical protein